MCHESAAGGRGGGGAGRDGRGSGNSSDSSSRGGRGRGGRGGGGDKAAEKTAADAEAHSHWLGGLSAKERRQWNTHSGAGKDRKVQVWVGECLARIHL